MKNTLIWFDVWYRERHKPHHKLCDKPGQFVVCKPEDCTHAYPMTLHNIVGGSWHLWWEGVGEGSKWDR